MAGFGGNVPAAIRAGGPPKAPAVKGPPAVKAPPKATPKQKAPAQHVVRQSAAARHLGAPKAQPRVQHGLGEMNQGDIHNQAVTQSRLARNAELAPLKAQSAEIQSNEQGASQAYGKLAEASQGALTGISANVQAGAKTAENHAAEAALQVPKAIETAGQNQASMTAGYMTPELRAELGAEAQQAGANQGARSLAAGNIAQEGGNLIEQLRGAASLKALGGQQNITGAFQKEQKANQTAQQTAIARSAANVPKIYDELAQKNFTDFATAQGLGLKTRALGQKAQETGARVKATERGQNISLQRNRESLAQRETASQRTAATAAANTALKKYQVEHPSASKSKGLTASETDAYITSLTGAYQKVAAYRKGATGKETPAQRAKSYEGLRRAVESGEHPEKYTSAEGEQKTRVVKEGKRNTTVATAAIELYNTHKVSASTRQALKNLGVELPPDNELFKMAGG